MAISRVPGPLGKARRRFVAFDRTFVRGSSWQPGPVGTASTRLVADVSGGAVKAGTEGETPEDAATKKKAAKDPEIEGLDLSSTARTAAYELKKQHPSVKFTSGRRDKNTQARAMAGNVTENRKWIEETYAKSDARDACQKWVDDNPKKTKKSEIQAGLLEVLNKLTDKELARLSKHLSGDAFDVQPVTKDADKIKATIRKLPGLTKFLEKEGGLVRWHTQF